MWKLNKQLAPKAEAQRSSLPTLYVEVRSAKATHIQLICHGRSSAVILPPLSILKRSSRFGPGLLLGYPDQFP